MKNSDTTESLKKHKSLGNIFARGWPLLLLAVLAAVIYWQKWYRLISIEELAINREFLLNYIRNNYLLSLLVYVGIYILAVAVSFPGATFLTLAGGLLFGWLIGGMATVLSATVGATVVFLVARSAVGEQFTEKAGPWLNRLRDGFNKDAFHYLLFLRLVPVFPFWLVNLAPGILGVRLRTFFLGTFIGIIPGTFAFVYAGVGLDSVIDAQLGPYQACLASGKTDCAFQFSPGSLVTKELLIAFALLGIVSLIPVVLKKFRKTD